MVTMTGMPQQTICWVVVLPLYAVPKLILGPTGSNPSISRKHVDLELMLPIFITTRRRVEKLRNCKAAILFYPEGKTKKATWSALNTDMQRQMREGGFAEGTPMILDGFPDPVNL